MYSVFGLEALCVCVSMSEQPEGVWMVETVGYCRGRMSYLLQKTWGGGQGGNSAKNICVSINVSPLGLN